MSERVIFHIDVNSAFLSWEAVERLKNGEQVDLREIPSAVGGDIATRHGVILAKSIPAKKYKVTTGEPVVDALRKCPELVVVQPHHELYQAYSRAFLSILKQYSDVIEKFSVDEAFVDMTGTRRLFGEPVEAAERMKNQVYRELGFTVNVGISSNKILAKMASDFQKPNRVHTLFPEEIPTKMWPLPVSELYMAGKSSVEILHKLEIRTIGELANTAPELLELHLKSHGRTLWEFANGIDSSKVIRERVESKGIGNSTTLSKDATTEDEARKVLLWLAETVAGRLRKEKMKAKMVSVEIKYSTFRSVSHQTQLQRPTSNDKAIYEVACDLFRELWNEEPIRLLGIRTSKLVDESEPEQMSIFDFQEMLEQDTPKDEKHEKLNKALDQIRKKYGDGAIVRGSLKK